jgi:hypothetical protein
MVGGEPCIEIERAARCIRDDEIEGLAAIELLRRLRARKVAAIDTATRSAEAILVIGVTLAVP